MQAQGIRQSNLLTDRTAGGSLNPGDRYRRCSSNRHTAGSLTLFGRECNWKETEEQGERERYLLHSSVQEHLQGPLCSCLCSKNDRKGC